MTTSQKISFFILGLGITLIHLPFILGILDIIGIPSFMGMIILLVVSFLLLLNFNIKTLKEFDIKNLLITNIFVLIILISSKGEPNVTAFGIISIIPIAIILIIIGVIQYIRNKKLLYKKS